MLQNYGSEGQCRIAVLVLKLATGELMIKKRENDDVIFLVDDVTGELDRERRQTFYHHLTKTKQVFLTSKSLEEIDDLRFSEIFQVNEGSVQKI